MQGKSSAKKQVDFSAQYSSDIFLPDMVYGALVRSPKKRGRIRSVTLPELPAEYRYFCVKDIIGKKHLTVNSIKIPIFAESETEYQGEPIGIITGPDETFVCSLRDDTTVELDETQPVFFSAQEEQNFSASRSTVFGDLSQLPEDLRVYKNSFLMTPKSIIDETYAVIAHCTKKTELYASVHLSAQLRATIAAVFNIHKDDIIVHKTVSNKETLNGSWMYALLATQAGIASLQLQKPVKLVLSRQEQMLYYNNASVPVIRHRTSVTTDGDIVCMDILMYLDAGVYSPHIQTVLDRMVIAACGIYAPKNARIEAFAVKTNNPPADFSLDYSDYQAFFAAETHIRHIAEDLNINPVELRKKNMFPQQQNVNTFFCLHDAEHLEKVIDGAVILSDYRRKYAAFNLIAKERKTGQALPLKGMGFAAAYNGNGSFNTPELKNRIAVEAVLEESGILTFFMQEPPQAVKNILFHIIRENLNINAQHVVFENDALLSPLLTDFFTLNKGISTYLIERICLEMKELYEKQPLPVRVKKEFRTEGNQIWDQEAFLGKPYISTAWGAAVAEIEIDTAVYEAILRNIWICIDAGKIHNEKNASAIIRRSVDRITDSLDIKRTASMKVHIEFVVSEIDFKEIEGIAEKIIPAAIFNAISQAVRQSIMAVPLDPKTLYAALTVQRDGA